MKKFLAILLAAMLVLSMTAVAFAEETMPSDMETVTITKVYNVENTGTTSPAETFEFTFANKGVTDAAAGVDVTNMPSLVSVSSVSFAQGDAGKVEEVEGVSVKRYEKEITVTLPSYESVGIYTYSIWETAKDTAGVTYYANEILLKVTVIQDVNNKIRVAAVHTESGFGGTEEDGTKLDSFENRYSAGKLAVNKQVTGNLGDRTKPFQVTVTFTAPAGKVVRAPIYYTDDENAVEITNWTTNADKTVTATAVITLKDDETVTFENIPYGVSYSVVETDSAIIAPEGGKSEYTVAYDGKQNGTIGGASAATVITNNKTSDIDTGITTDTLPYVLLMGIVLLAGAAMIIKRRAHNN